MKWSHLPVHGGIYDQHPKLIDDWMILFDAIAEEQAKEKAKTDAEVAAARAKTRQVK